MKLDLFKIACGVLSLVVIAGGLWAWFNAPCGFYTYARTTETPARCLMHR